jgi:hypothetical protein
VVQRALGRLVGLQEGELRRLVRVSYAKVAEFQRRGAIHFHAVIRLDAATDWRCPSCLAPPPEPFTTGLLEDTLRQAVPDVRVPCPSEEGEPGRYARWGEQLDVHNITRADGDQAGELSAEQVAGYIAKYATKATEALGVTLDHRISEADLDDFTLPVHVPSSSGPAWSWVLVRAWRGCAWASGRTCLASAVISRPRAAGIRPPWGPCGGPGLPMPSAGAVATPCRWMRGDSPRTTRP